MCLRTNWFLMSRRYVYNVKKALQDSSLGKNMLPLRESCHHESSFDAKILLFRNLHQNEQFKVPKTL